MRYEKPVDADRLRRHRQQLVADRVLRWRDAVVGEDEVVSVRRWWSLSELYRAFTEGWHRPTPPTWERFYEAFLEALEAGAFDAAGKTRVALLDPTLSTELPPPWPQLRLNHHRAQQLVGPSGDWSPYRRLADAWIEIDRAYKWIMTWVEPAMVQSWRQVPQIAQSLRAAAQHAARKAAVRAKAAIEPLPQSAVIDAPPSPTAPRLQAAVESTIAALGWPARQLPWQRFCDEVRARCDVGPNDRGYGDKTIRRIVSKIGEKQHK